MSDIWSDVRHSARRMRRHPGFAGIIILTLALGIGATAAVFSLVNGLLLRPLPYPEPDRLVQLNHFYPTIDNFEAAVSAAGFRRYSTEIRSLEMVSAQAPWGTNLTGDGDPERLQGAQISASWLQLYGVIPALGRGFLPEETQPGENRVVLLSDGLWRTRFGSDPAIVGRLLNLDGEAYEVVGVMPADFRPFFSNTAGGSDIYRPLALTESQYAAGYTFEFLTVAGRLAPGRTVADAQRELDAYAAQLREEFSLAPRWTILATTLNDRAHGQIRPALLVLLGAVALVLLIACANVANLLLARAAGRRREVAVRLALGARGPALIRQLLVESGLLAAAGGILGLLMSAWILGVLQRSGTTLVPGIENVRLDGNVVAFTAAVALLTSVMFGLTPALQAVRIRVEPTLRESGRSAAGDRAANLLRRVLVVAEFALALTLVAGAGLLIQSFTRLSAVDPGFRAEGLLVFNINLPSAKFPTDTLRVQQFDALIARLEQVPGVEAVGATSTLPFSGDWSTSSFQVEGFQPGDGEPGPWGDLRVVNAGFIDAMGIPLLRGRFFDTSDQLSGRRVAVVDEEMVRRYWPDVDPIGQRITFDGEQYVDIIGVIGHSAHEGLDADPRVQLYFPQGPYGIGSMWFAVRTSGDPYALANPIRQAIWSVDPEQPISRLSTMDELMSDTAGPRRLVTSMLTAFAAFALLLASMGVYGVMSHMVAQRRPELGLRMAIGAGQNRILSMVLRQGFNLVVIGSVLGLIASLMLNRVLESQLFGVSATDPATLLGVVALLGTIAAVATLLPALRATRIDPLVALRQE